MAGLWVFSLAYIWVRLASFTATTRDYLDSLEAKFRQIGNDPLLDNTAAQILRHELDVYLFALLSLLLLLVFALALRVLMLELGLSRPSHNGVLVLFTSLLVVGFLGYLISFGLYFLQESIEPGLDSGLTAVGEYFLGTLDPAITINPPSLEYYSPNPFVDDSH